MRNIHILLLKKPEIYNSKECKGCRYWHTFPENYLTLYLSSKFTFLSLCLSHIFKDDTNVLLYTGKYGNISCSAGIVLKI